MRLLKSLLLCVMVHGIGSYKYYYKRIGNGFDIIYAQHAFGGYQELKSPKSLKMNHDSRGERPGVCNHGPFFCSVSYQRSATQHFECTLDYQCPRFFKCCQPLCFVHKVCQPALGMEASSTRLPQPTITTDIWKTSTNIFSPTTSTETHQEVISTEATENTNTYFTTEPEPEPKLNKEVRTSSEAIEHTSIEPTSREPPETESTETDEISELTQMGEEISTEISSNAEPSGAESPANIQITFSKTTVTDLEPKMDVESRTPSELREQTSTELPSKEPSQTESSETDEMRKLTQMGEEISTNEPSEVISPVDVQITTSSKITKTEPKPKMDVVTRISSEAGKHTSTDELASREPSQTESPKTDGISESTQMVGEISTEISTITEPSRAESPSNKQKIPFSKTTETELDSKSKSETGASSEAREQKTTELPSREAPETESPEIIESTQMGEEISTEIFTIAEPPGAESPANIQITPFSKTTETELESKSNAETGTSTETRRQTSTESMETFRTESDATQIREETSTEISTNESSETESPEIQWIAPSKTTETLSHGIIEPGKETDTSTPSEKIGQISTPITLSEPSELESIPTIGNSISTETMAQINTAIFINKPHEAESPANMEIRTSSKTTKTSSHKPMKPEKGADIEMSTPSATRGKSSTAFTSTEPSETKPSLNIETNTSIETTLNNEDSDFEMYTKASLDSESTSEIINSSSETVGWVSTQHTTESSNNTERGTLTEESPTKITTSILSESESPKNKNFNSTSEIEEQTTDEIDTNLSRENIISSESRKVMTTDMRKEESTTQLTMTTGLPNNSSLGSNISEINFTGTAYTSSYITDISSEKSIIIVTTELRPDSSGPPTDTKINNSSVQSVDQPKHIIKTASDDFSISAEEISDKPPVTETSFELNNQSSRYIPTVGKSSEIYVISGSNKEHITEKNQSAEVKFDEQRKSNMSHTDQNDHFEENRVENLTQIVSESEKHRSFSTEENKYRETSSYLTDDEDLAGSGDFYSNNDGSGDFYSDNDSSGDNGGDGSGDGSDLDTEEVTSTRKIEEKTNEIKKQTTAGIDTNESGARKPTSKSVNNTYSESKHQRQEGSTTQLPTSTELPNTSFGTRSPSFPKVPSVESTGTADTRNTSFHVSELSSQIYVPITTQSPSIFSGTPTYIGINSSSIKRNYLDTLEQVPVVGAAVNNTSGIDHEEKSIETTEVVDTVSDDFSISTETSTDKPPVTETSFELGNKTSKFIPEEKSSVGESSELNATIPDSDKKQYKVDKDQSTDVKFDEQMKANISHTGQDDRFDSVQNITISSAKETDGINSEKTVSESEKPIRKVSESEKNRIISTETSESLTDDEDLASFSGSGDFYSGNDSSGDGSGNGSGDEKFVFD